MTLHHRHETFDAAGNLIRVVEVQVDLTAGTITETVDGGVPTTRALTAEERDFYDPPPTVEERLAQAERPEHVQEWVAPTGAHDAPGIGDHRWHAGKVWRSTIVGNTVEPGNHPGFDWWVETEPPAIPDKLRNPLRALRPALAAASNAGQVRDATLAILDTLTGDA